MLTPPPPPQTKVAIVEENTIYHCENLVGPFLVHKLLPPPPSLLIHPCACTPCCLPSRMSTLPEPLRHSLLLLDRSVPVRPSAS